MPTPSADHELRAVRLNGVSALMASPPTSQARVGPRVAVSVITCVIGRKNAALVVRAGITRPATVLGAVKTRPAFQVLATADVFITRVHR